MKKKSLIALFWVADLMSASEKISKKVQMTRDTLHYVKDARLKYKEDLCQKRQEEENERNSLKRKIVDHEIKQITALCPTR